jgi:hypothetical protein
MKTEIVSEISDFYPASTRRLIALEDFTEVQI